jgi:asparagine synthase (glutamine-hydrolysing)
MNPTVPVSGNATAFAGIEQLPAGHNLVITRHGRRQAPFWSYAGQAGSYDLTRPEETFRELFADAVRLRLRSDVSTALLLSGGLDSSSIAVYARADAEGGPLDAFTFTFPGFNQDERHYAELVAAQSGIHLHSVEYDPAYLFDDLAAATWHMDEPASGGQLLARWRLLEAASGRARIVLEGQGADEMLGGYSTRYRLPYIRSELAQLTLGNLHRKLPLMLSALTGLDPQWPKRTLRALRSTKFRPAPRYGVLSPDLSASDRDPEQPGHWHWPDPLSALLQRDHAWLVLPHLLHFGDALSMAHSVESRLPFLDHRLVEFIFALPFDAKIRGSQTKYILRKAFAGRLPRRIVQRRDKVGFATPLHAWLAPRLDEVRSLLASSRVRNRGIFDANGLARCLAEAEAGKFTAVNLLFRCLALETWFEQFIDGNGPPARAVVGRA